MDYIIPFGVSQHDVRVCWGGQPCSRVFIKVLWSIVYIKSVFHHEYYKLMDYIIPFAVALWGSRV